MNVMKKDAMDDKIKERCKTCEKQYMQEDLDKLRSYRVEANLDGLRICQGFINQIESFSMDWEAIETKSRNLDGLRLR